MVARARSLSAFALRTTNGGVQVGALRGNRLRRSAARLLAHNEVYLMVQPIQASNQAID